MGKEADPTILGPLSALADKTRYEIMRHIAANWLIEGDTPREKVGKSVCVNDLVVHFELSQPTISHHLKILEQAGLLSKVNKGTYTFWSVDQERLSEVLRKVKLDLSGPGWKPHQK